jgi:hypothetical protein
MRHPPTAVDLSRQAIKAIADLLAGIRIGHCSAPMKSPPADQQQYLEVYRMHAGCPRRCRLM